MYAKSKIEAEGFYWQNQIIRHHIGKRVRKLVRKINCKPYSKLSKLFRVNRKTIWAIANGLTTASGNFLEKLNEIEKYYFYKRRQL